MSSPFLGELRLISFNFPPKGWAFCNGQLMPINQNQALFALLGTMYGGDGQQTFALPNLEGRIIVGSGQGPGLSSYTQGQQGGVESVTVTLPQMHYHTHPFGVYSGPGNIINPSGEHLAASPANVGPIFGVTKTTGTMPASMVQSVGGGQPHENRMPTLTLNYIIALQGIFPSQS